MSDFTFLSKYVFENPQGIDHKTVKHSLIKLNKSDITCIEEYITIPHELKEFWLQIGYGFFHNKSEYSFDRLLDPYSFKIINLRQDYYEFDPDLELYSHEDYKDKLIFLEINEGVCLLIDKVATDGKNAVYYFDKKIADSLEDFVKRFDNEVHYFENMEQ
jgi:antitoxin YxxD